MRPRTFLPPLGWKRKGKQPPVPSASGESANSVRSEPSRCPTSIGNRLLKPILQRLHAGK